MADLLVEATPDGFVITRPGVTRPLVPVVEGEGREERTVLALERVARWLRLSALTNPATGLAADAVRVEVDAGHGRRGRRRHADDRVCRERRPALHRPSHEHHLRPAVGGAARPHGDVRHLHRRLPGRVCRARPGESTSVDLLGQVTDALWEAGTASLA